MASIPHKPFFPNQNQKDKDNYIRMITGMAQASRAFSDSLKPYLSYRVVEKIFCKSFRAEDKSRQDVSVDAVKAKDGIGIKTFVSGSKTKRNKYEKIAEFVNRKKYPLNESNVKEMIKQVAEYRNFRIKQTVKQFDLASVIYHYLVRDIGKIHVCECDMIPIDINNIYIPSLKPCGNIVRFEDSCFNYHFHLSKHTLFKQFSYKKPFFTIKVNQGIDEKLLTWTIRELSNKGKFESSLLKKYDYVLLPLYSTLTGEVPKKSGVNQWNAGGRKRDYNEVYIPIPRIVHKRKPNFFPPRDKKFRLITSDDEELVAKVCQDNSKALMSDPNKRLGKWLLRRMLKLKKGEIADIEYLRERQADTVIIYKLGENKYKISLHTFGSFSKEYN